MVWVQEGPRIILKPATMTDIDTYRLILLRVLQVMLLNLDVDACRCFALTHTLHNNVLR